MADTEKANQTVVTVSSYPKSNEAVYQGDTLSSSMKEIRVLSCNMMMMAPAMEASAADRGGMTLS